MAAEITQDAVRQWGWVCAVVLTIAPIANTLLATAVSGIKELGRGARRIQALDEAKKRVEFWQSWFDLLEKPATASNEGLQLRMKADLIKTADILDERLAPKIEEIRVFLTASAFRRFRRCLPWWRRLFLMYRPPTEAAKRARFRFLWLLTADLMFCGLAIFSVRDFNRQLDELSRPLPPLSAPAAAPPAATPADPQAGNPVPHQSSIYDLPTSLSNYSSAQTYANVPYVAPATPGLLTILGQILSNKAEISYSSIISITIPLAWLAFTICSVPAFIMWWHMRKIETSPKVYRRFREARKRKERRRTLLSAPPFEDRSLYNIDDPEQTDHG